METDDALTVASEIDGGGDAEDVSLGCGSGDEAGVSGGGEKPSRDRVKGPWSPEEDAILSRLVSKFGARNWSLIARGLAGRSGKSCRLRWCYQLDPAVKRKPFSGNSFLLYVTFFIFLFLCFVVLALVLLLIDLFRYRFLVLFVQN